MPKNTTRHGRTDVSPYNLGHRPPDEARRQPMVEVRDRLRDMLRKLDRLIVAGARGAGRAVLSGLAAYADAMRGFEPDFYLHPDFRDETADGGISTPDHAASVAIVRKNNEPVAASVWTTDDLPWLLDTECHGQRRGTEFSRSSPLPASQFWPPWEATRPRYPENEDLTPRLD